jgi:hypothetical protein
MSAYDPKAGIQGGKPMCPLMTHSGHCSMPQHTSHTRLGPLSRLITPQSLRLQRAPHTLPNSDVIPRRDARQEVGIFRDQIDISDTDRQSDCQLVAKPSNNNALRAAMLKGMIGKDSFR